MTRPSPLAERLLALLIGHEEWREAITGDLREEFEALARTRGDAAARRWHWGEVLAIGGRRVLGRSPRTLRRGRAVPEPREQGAWLQGLGRDVAYAARSLARRPGLSAVVVLMLGVGLAANATIFSVADALVLRPFRFPAVDRLVVLGSISPNERFITSSVAPGDFVEWQEQLRTMTHLAGIQWWEPNLVGRDEPEQLAGFYVSPGYFEALGVEPVLGRAFRSEEGHLGQHRRVVISHALWARRFASDPSIVGQSLRLDGEPHEVIGVAPPGFKIPLGAEIWAPLVLEGETRLDRRNGNLTIVGRLADGVTIEQARGEIEPLVARQRAEHPDTNAGRSVRVEGFTQGMADPGTGTFLAVFQAAAALLLIIACANVANLLLARGAEREQEFAVRLALGAGRWRVARQVLLEGAMLAGAAVALAVPLAWAGVPLSRRSVPGSVIRFIPGWDHLYLQPRALVVASLLAGLATLVFSLAPALQGVRAAVADTLRQGGRTTTASRPRVRGRTMLAAAQIGLTLALLTASALAIRAAQSATHGDQGFDPREVIVARLLLPNMPYDDVERRRQFTEEVLERLRALPAARYAAATSSLPYGGQNVGRLFYPEGVDVTPADLQRVDLRQVTPEIFDVLRIPLVAGRGFTPLDRADGVPVAIVSRALADRYWPGADPLGRRFRLAESGPWLQVVGVAGDVTHDWFQRLRGPTVYRPAAQAPPYNLNIVVRTAGDPVALGSDLRRAIRAVDPDQPVREIATLQRIVDERASGLSTAASILTVIGGIALLLALVGIYSLMAYLASRRSQEIGVRLAFGATRWDVMRLTVLQATRITAFGIVVGLALAMIVGQAMQAALFGAVEASLGLTAAIAALLAAAAVLASYLPARRTARVDPTIALKAE